MAEPWRGDFLLREPPFSKQKLRLSRVRADDWGILEKMEEGC